MTFAWWAGSCRGVMVGEGEAGPVLAGVDVLDIANNVI
jgi:hypothetical protein